MRNGSLFIFFLFCLVTANGFAQSDVSSLLNPKGDEVVIGKTYTFESKKIAGSWKVQVSLPPGYMESKDIYPVVYALHGGFYFKFAVGGLQRLMEFGDIPEVIVVGISNESNSYFAFGTEGANQFLDFMEEDIFPFVKHNFRTHKDRTIMGWHYTSGFIFHALVERPHLFKNYLPASPYLQGYDVSSIDFKVLNELVVDQPLLRKSLYFGVFSNERSVSMAALSLDSLLRKKAPENLKWRFKMVEPDYDEGIDISVYRLWQAGLKTMYAPYRADQKEYAGLEDFKAQGGSRVMEQYYIQRAVKYGGSSKPPGLFSLIIQAERAGDFSLFEELMAVFGDNYEHFNMNRVMGFAAFYVEHGKVDQAIAIYENINGYYPNSVSIYEAIGQAYIKKGDNRKAITAYDTAIELAKVQSDDRLNSLVAKLAELR